MEKFNLNPHHTRHPGKHSATLGNFREDRHSYIVIPDDDVRRRSGIQGNLAKYWQIHCRCPEIPDSDSASLHHFRSLPRTRRVGDDVVARSVGYVWIVALLIGLLAILPQTTHAQTDDSHVTLSERDRPEGFEPLQEYFNHAIENNPELQALGYSYEAQRQVARQVGVLPDPEVNVGFFVNPAMAETFMGRFSISAMQMFPWPGTLSTREDEMLHMSEGDRAMIRTESVEILRDIHINWLDYSEQDLSRSIIQEQIEELQDLEGLVEIRYETTRAGQADLLRIEMEKERIRNRLESVEDELRPIRAELNNLMNREAEEDIESPEAMSLATLELDEQQLAERIRDHNPEWERLDAREDQYRSSLERARLEGRPEFGLGVEVMGRDFSMMSGMDDMNEGVVAMATVRLPIYRTRYRAQREEAQNRIRSVEVQREETDNRLLSRLERYQKDRRDADREIRLLEDELIPRAEQALEVLSEEYRGGNVRFDEVLQVQRELLDLELELLQAQTAHNRSIAQIEWLIAAEVQ